MPQSGIPEEARKVLVPAIEKAVKLQNLRLTRWEVSAEYKSPAELRKMTEEDYKKAL